MNTEEIKYTVYTHSMGGQEGDLNIKGDQEGDLNMVEIKVGWLVL